VKKISGSQNGHTSPKAVARVLECTERSVRDYCREGKIPEAFRTPAGHWRIALPLSGETKLFLQRIRGEWPFNGGKEVEGEFDSDIAGWLMEAMLYGKDWQECFPAPELADLEPSKREAAAKIQSLIWERLKSGDGFSDLLLLGLVYQFWLKTDNYPSVGEVADLMGISRSEFFRRGHSAVAIRNAYHAICERIGIQPLAAS
jgi:hypothetical protein